MFCLSLIGLHGGWGKSVVRETFSFEEIGQVDVARVTGFRKEMRAFGHNAPPNGAAVVVAAAAAAVPPSLSPSLAPRWLSFSTSDQGFSSAIAASE